MGVWKYLTVYFLSGLASALLYWATAWIGSFENLQEPCVGASGAISGLLGLYAVRFPRFKIRLWYAAIIPFPFIIRHGVARISSIFFLVFWIGVQLLLGVQSLRAHGGIGVAYWGHIGGFMLGLAYGLVTREWRCGEQEYLIKEADHLFYKQKWYQAMEAYKRLADRYPRYVEAFIKQALCWECTGVLKRSEKVLQEALQFYTEQGWKQEAAIVEEELRGMTGSTEPTGPSQEALFSTDPAAHQTPRAPNLLFRRNFKSKEKSP